MADGREGEAFVTPEERDRLAKLEERVRGLDETMTGMDEKLDQLIAAANMGRGAWWMILRLGGLMVVMGGAVGWAADHFGWWK